MKIEGLEVEESLQKINYSTTEFDEILRSFLSHSRKLARIVVVDHCFLIEEDLDELILADKK